MTNIIEWSKGNPGAMVFLMEFLKPENAVLGIKILSKLENAKSIRGTNLYVLWSDLCNKDLSEVALLCEKVPIEILEDACSRQDYSGRKLISEYLFNTLSK
jgi:hypothetical protein